MIKILKICVIFLILTFFLVLNNAFASWYIINADTGLAVSITEYLPDESDLAQRNEFAVESDKVIPLGDAEYFNGKIRQRVKSATEKDQEKEKKDKTDDMAVIEKRILKDACELLIAEGHVFKKLKCSDFD